MRAACVSYPRLFVGFPSKVSAFPAISHAPKHNSAARLTAHSSLIQNQLPCHRTSVSSLGRHGAADTAEHNPSDATLASTGYAANALLCSIGSATPSSASRRPVTRPAAVGTIGRTTPALRASPRRANRDRSTLLCESSRASGLCDGGEPRLPEGVGRDRIDLFANARLVQAHRTVLDLARRSKLCRRWNWPDVTTIGMKFGEPPRSAVKMCPSFSLPIHRIGYDLFRCGKRAGAISDAVSTLIGSGASHRYISASCKVT